MCRLLPRVTFEARGRILKMCGDGLGSCFWMRDKRGTWKENWLCVVGLVGRRSEYGLHTYAPFYSGLIFCGLVVVVSYIREILR
jgi:hypothetical protein